MPKLSEEFDAVLQSLGKRVTGLKRERLVFADLIWDSMSSREVLALAHNDPAFTVEGESRLVALHRVGSEIRYWAGPLMSLLREHGSDPWEEMGILGCVEDAVCLVEEYLSGHKLEDIAVKRTIMHRGRVV